MAKQKLLRDRDAKDFSFEELVKLKVQLKRKYPRLNRKMKKEAAVLLLMIDEELEDRGFGKEAELKQSINQKPQPDERKN